MHIPFQRDITGCSLSEAVILVSINSKYDIKSVHIFYKKMFKIQASNLRLGGQFILSFSNKFYVILCK